jgi:hypothetical protein
MPGYIITEWLVGWGGCLSYSLLLRLGARRRRWNLFRLLRYGVHSNGQIPNPCIFPTDLAAYQAIIAYYKSIPNSLPTTIDYCNGNGWCHWTAIDIAGGLTLTGIVQIGHTGDGVNPPICPTPTVNPTVPYFYNYSTLMCERAAQQNLTITIEPAGTYLPTNGTYTILPSTALPLDAIVKDQNGLVQAGKQVALTVSVQDDTNGVQDGNGGHIHKENRPKGKFACSAQYDPGSETATCTLTTDGSGKAPFIFIPTAVSGAHTITATCSGCGNTATAPVNVKVDNLITIPASPRYALSDSNGVIGAIPGQHTDNHYLTAAAITKLTDFATNYQKTVNPRAKLYLNDASLVWGGLFDVDVNKPWSTPHNGHDRGVSIDIRAANSGVNNEGAVPPTLFDEVSKSAAQVNAKAALHCMDNGVLQIGKVCNGIPNNRHFHVDF